MTPEKPLLRDVAYQEIKARILKGELYPTQVLSERFFIELLAMSKTPIKSALAKLESEGFVTVTSNQGVMIRDLTVERIVHIYDLRVALESYVVERISGKLLREHVAKLEANLLESQRAIEEGDGEAFTEIDHQFHLLLCECFGNKEIYHMLLRYNAHLQRITLKHLQQDMTRMTHFHKEHVNVVDALIRGDGQARRLIVAHLEGAKRQLFL
ncbi:GntR family transcriptional regulator [Shouchella sp. 1P09AA]|uniref:GntR family transcriptional regulator n=1 Tax=unclassified Shouchella TaxID=2893065 RepID=UPI0039A39C98